MNAGEAMFDDDAVFDAVMKSVCDIKQRMKDRGFNACRCTCPGCHVRSAAVARLAGPRQHLHLRCTKCSFFVME
jgi:hypothetical protein